MIGTKKIQPYDEKVVLNVIRWCRAQISPFAAFFGGIVAHEIIKSTGKYEPIDQWLIMDFFEILIFYIFYIFPIKYFFW